MRTVLLLRELPTYPHALLLLLLPAHFNWSAYPGSPTQRRIKTGAGRGLILKHA